VVLGANLFLRPVAQVINRTSRVQTELPVRYGLHVICLSQHQNHIRSLLLQEIDGGPLLLHALQTKETTDPATIEVWAELQGEGHQDTILERAVALLSLEESVSSIRWELISDELKEGTTSLLGE
jgi:putative Mg2+ transporter-C (MgtC) family protein